MLLLYSLAFFRQTVYAAFMNRIVVTKFLVLPVLAIATYVVTPLVYRSHVDEAFPVSAKMVMADEDAQQKDTLNALKKVAMFTGQNDHVADGVAMMFSFTEKNVLRLENMFVSNAHLLEVQVQVTVDGVQNWENIDNLKADTGAFNYDLPKEINPANITAVRIVQAVSGTVFGVAEFTKE